MSNRAMILALLFGIGVEWGYVIGYVVMRPPAPTTHVKIYGPSPSTAELLRGK